jgi:hypothetical protein
MSTSPCPPFFQLQQWIAAYRAALDRVCHEQIFEKRKAMGVKVNDHPRFTDYLRQAETLGLGDKSNGSNKCLVFDMDAMVHFVPFFQATEYRKRIFNVWFFN